MTPATLASLIIHHAGCWQPAQVRARGVASSWPADIAELNGLIDRTWSQAQSRGTIHLFDGPMCRLESVRHSGADLLLELSRTSYKLFYGTNLTHPEVAERFGLDALARPIGVSPALLSVDGYLLLGRRNASVAYYPNRLHPFAGSLEPDDALDVFAAVRRELREELSLRDGDLVDIVCTGIVEDTRLRQSELIFAAHCRLTRDQIASQVHAAEHLEAWSVPATADQIAKALVEQKHAFTPVACASMLLFGRIAFGAAWFDECKSVAGVA